MIFWRFKLRQYYFGNKDEKAFNPCIWQNRWRSSSWKRITVYVGNVIRCSLIEIEYSRPVVLFTNTTGDDQGLLDSSITPFWNISFTIRLASFCFVNITLFDIFITSIDSILVQIRPTIYLLSGKLKSFNISSSRRCSQDFMKLSVNFLVGAVLFLSLWLFLQLARMVQMLYFLTCHPNAINDWSSFLLFKY